MPEKKYEELYLIEKSVNKWNLKNNNKNLTEAMERESRVFYD